MLEEDLGEINIFSPFYEKTNDIKYMQVSVCIFRKFIVIPFHKEAQSVSSSELAIPLAQDGSQGVEM